MEGWELSDLLTDLPLNLINILLLYLIVSRLVYKPVKKLMDDRARRLQAARDAAAAAQAQAEEKSRQYDALMADARAEAERLLAEARAKAASEGQRILDDARAQAQTVLANARAEAKAAHDAALAGLRDEVADLAVDIAEKLLERTVTDADTKRMADAFFADWPGPESGESAQSADDAAPQPPV